MVKYCFFLYTLQYIWNLLWNIVRGSKQDRKQDVCNLKLVRLHKIQSMYKLLIFESLAFQNIIYKYK